MAKMKDLNQQRRDVAMAGFLEAAKFAAETRCLSEAIAFMESEMTDTYDRLKRAMNVWNDEEL